MVSGLGFSWMVRQCSASPSFLYQKHFLYPCVEAERVQVGSGLFTLKDMSRSFDYFAALLAVTIPALILPNLNLFPWPCFPE